MWQFATERYRENFQAVQPYYVMVQLPEQAELEFVLMIPFTPKNKNVINAWMAGRCDVPNYGKIVVYSLPKGVEMLGPRQIEARIDQDTEMSRALSLWSQRGSQVIRGNLLTIPLFDGETLYLMYAEPIFLQAEDAQLPEVKRIVLADQEDVVWADTFDGALRLLLGRSAALAPGAAEAAEGEAPAAAPSAAAVMPAELEGQIGDASRAFSEYQRLMGNGEFSRAGERLEELRGIIQDLSGRLETGGGSD